MQHIYFDLYYPLLTVLFKRSLKKSHFLLQQTKFVTLVYFGFQQTAFASGSCTMVMRPSTRLEFEKGKRIIKNQPTNHKNAPSKQTPNKPKCCAKRKKGLLYMKNPLQAFPLLHNKRKNR